MNQRAMPPELNKFHLGNGSDKKHYWLTPPVLYEALSDKETNPLIKTLKAALEDKTK